MFPSVESILAGFRLAGEIMQSSTMERAKGNLFRPAYVHVSGDKVEAGERKGRASFSQMTQMVAKVLQDNHVERQEKIELLNLYEKIISSYESKIEKWGFLPHIFPFLFRQIGEVEKAHQFVHAELQVLSKAVFPPDLTGVAQCIDNEGTLYEGYFEGGELKSGEAKTQEGMILKGHFDGFGRMQGEGEVIIGGALFYKGAFVNDKPRGEGIAYLPGELESGIESRIICGTFKGGLRGTGKISYASGDIYEGEFEAGREEGMGKLKTADGRVFEGRFREGKYLGGRASIRRSV